MVEADVVEDVPVALILRLFNISLTLLILIPLAMISIRSSIVSPLCLGSSLWPLYCWLIDQWKAVFWLNSYAMWHLCHFRYIYIYIYTFNFYECGIIWIDFYEWHQLKYLNYVIWKIPYICAMEYYEWQYLLYEQIKMSFMIAIVRESFFLFSLNLLKILIDVVKKEE